MELRAVQVQVEVAQPVLVLAPVGLAQGLAPVVVVQEVQVLARVQLVVCLVAEPLLRRVS